MLNMTYITFITSRLPQNIFCLVSGYFGISLSYGTRDSALGLNAWKYCKSGEIDVSCVFYLGCKVAPSEPFLICIWNAHLTQFVFWARMHSRHNCLMSSAQFIYALFQTWIDLSKYWLSGIQDTMDTSFVEP